MTPKPILVTRMIRIRAETIENPQFRNVVAKDSPLSGTEVTDFPNKIGPVT